MFRRYLLGGKLGTEDLEDFHDLFVWIRVARMRVWSPSPLEIVSTLIVPGIADLLTLLENLIHPQEHFREVLGTTSTTPVLLRQKPEAAGEAFLLVIRNAYFTLVLNLISDNQRTDLTVLRIEVNQSPIDEDWQVQKCLEQAQTITNVPGMVDQTLLGRERHPGIVVINLLGLLRLSVGYFHLALIV